MNEDLDKRILERILSLIPKKPDGKYVHGAKKALADYLGLTHTAVTEWISGKNRSYRRYLYQIADFYNVSVEWIKCETDEKGVASATTDELTEYLEMLRSRPECRILLDTAKGASKDQVEQNVRFLEALRKANAD